jgi:DNA-binding NarL/FixJ family response regulator
MVASDGWFLVVDDDADVVRVLARVLGRYGPTKTASTCTTALAMLDDRLAGLIVDMGLPDGEGLTVLRAALGRRPSLPTLVLTGSDDPRYCHDAFALGAGYLRKPGTGREIEAFGRRAAGAARSRAGRVGDTITRWALRHGLTPRETEIVTAAMDGADHARLAALGNVTVATIKTQVHGVLRKVGTNTLQKLVSEILRDALDS